MSLHITTEEVGDVVVVICKGNITENWESIILRKVLVRLTREDRFKIVLNLKNVSRINCVGIHEILDPIIEVRENKGDIKLLWLHTEVRSKFKGLMLHKMFEIFRTKKKALKSFEE